METCKECRHYLSNKGERIGTCTKNGDQNLIENNSTIIDKSEDDLYPYHLEVGENFGCIHFESK